jgi:hypothetical protein
MSPREEVIEVFERLTPENQKELVKMKFFVRYAGIKLRFLQL